MKWTVRAARAARASPASKPCAPEMMITMLALLRAHIVLAGAAASLSPPVWP